jgi:hypothetical protein
MVKRRHGNSLRLSVPFDDDMMSLLKSKAQQNGMSAGPYVSALALNGLISDVVSDAESRIGGLLDRLENLRLHPELVHSIFLIESLVTNIVKTQDIEVLYSAQKDARTKADQLLGEL